MSSLYGLKFSPQGLSGLLELRMVKTLFWLVEIVPHSFSLGKCNSEKQALPTLSKEESAMLPRENSQRFTSLKILEFL